MMKLETITAEKLEMLNFRKYIVTTLYEHTTNTVPEWQKIRYVEYR